MGSYILLGLSIVFNVIAQFLLKLGAKASVDSEAAVPLTAKLVQLISNPLFIGALVSYGVSFVVYYGALSNIELSKAYPILAITVLILVLIGSVIFLNETINSVKILGAILSIIGIVLIFWKG